MEFLAGIISFVVLIVFIVISVNISRIKTEIILTGRYRQGQKIMVIISKSNTSVQMWFYILG